MCKCELANENRGLDGHSTKGKDPVVAKKSLATRLAEVGTEYKVSTTVHCIGFTDNHNFALLDSLRVLGSSEGVFRYGVGCVKLKLTEVL